MNERDVRCREKSMRVKPVSSFPPVLLPGVVRLVPAARLDARDVSHGFLKRTEERVGRSVSVQDGVPHPGHDAVVSVEGRLVVRTVCAARDQQAGFLRGATGGKWSKRVLVWWWVNECSQCHLPVHSSFTHTRRPSNRA